MDSDDEMIDDRPARPRRGRVRRYVAPTAAAVTLLVLGAAGGILWSERYGGEPRAKRAAPARDAQLPAASPRGGSMPGMPGMSAPAGQAAPAKAEGAGEVALTPAPSERARIRIAEGNRPTAVS